MKYMVSCRQSVAYLMKSDEIKVNYGDKAILSHLVGPEEESTYKGEINIYIPRGTNIDWNYFEPYRQALNLVIAPEDTYLLREARTYGYKAFWAYPVSTYQELDSLVYIGVDEILIDGPLYFDVENVKKLAHGVELRMNPIQCYPNQLPHTNGIRGTYVRPEDVNLYEPYVEHMEFGDLDLAAERVYVEVYNKQKWPGNLNLLLKNLNYNIDNRGLNSPDLNLGLRRRSCQQKCLQGSVCRRCEFAFQYVTYLDQNKDELVDAYNLNIEPEPDNRTVEELKKHIEILRNQLGAE